MQGLRPCAPVNAVTELLTGESSFWLFAGLHPSIGARHCGNATRTSCSEPFRADDDDGHDAEKQYGLEQRWCPGPVVEHVDADHRP